MKIFSLLLTGAFFYSNAFSQTLFTFGNQAVDKTEFIRAYNKNKTETTDNEKALREYLELYTKFKLKVKAAKDMRLDTLPQLINDLQNFRSQINETYMNNNEAVKNLIREAVNNSYKDIHTLHFFIPVAVNAPAADSVKAVAGATEFYNQLKAGRKDYEKLTAAITEKYTPARFADIGYVTTFTLPYEYEKIIYNLKTGAASQPYRSKKGWHIFINNAERKNPGKWRAAQILLAFPPGNTAENYAAQQHLADSLYNVLKAGGNFAALAQQYSNDKITYMAGGELPEFTTGRYAADFETAVFNLTKDGEVSKPFTTSFGFHLVKRLSVKPLPADAGDASYEFEIKQRVQQDARINAPKELFTQSVVKQIAYKRNTAVKDAELFRYADSVVSNPGEYEIKNYPISKKPVYTFAKSTLTGADWLRFVREYKTNPELYKGENNTALLQKFTAVKAMDYYRTNLEIYNPDFKYQLDEFKEGNLLFEIMERKIWSAAEADNEGLKKYYAANKNRYLWGISADVLIFSTGNKAAADAAYTAAAGGKDWKTIAEQSNGSTQADSGRYELNQLALPENITPAAGMVTPVVVNAADGAASFIKIVALHTAGQQRSFDEARGLVINDYQNLLEEKWIAELRKKYPVKVNEGVFKSLLK